MYLFVFPIYKVRHVDPKIPHLSANELKALEEKEITIKRLAVVRDIFIFSCYTGFAYADVASLTSDHIKIGDDGKRWLIKLVVVDFVYPNHLNKNYLIVYGW